MPKATVSSCAFTHTQDIDEDERVSVTPIDSAMDECVNWAVSALHTASPPYTEFQTMQIGALLSSMRWTHRAIRKALGWADKPMAVDGLSLARIPLEGSTQ